MYDIAIIGNGIVGLCATLSIARSNSNLKITIISDKTINKSEHVLAINASNIRQLLSIGVVIPNYPYSIIEQMKIFGDKNSKLNFDHLINSNYYSKILSVQEVIDLIQTEIDNTNNISQICGKLHFIENLSTHNNLQINLQDSNKIDITCKIIIGADGSNSLVRKLANIEINSIKYDHIAFTGTFNCETEHHNTAIQYFLPNGGIIAYLPYGYKSVSIVYSCPKTDNIMMKYLKNVNEPNIDEINNHIAFITKYHCGKMNLVGKLNYYNLQMNLVDKFYNNNIVLIGDAAHTIHPLAGQGINLGLQDVWELTNILKNDFYSNKLNEKLKKYNRSRIIAARKIQLACHGLLRLFNVNTPIVIAARNYGMNLVNKSVIVKKILLIR
jgi:2-octaprenylphenol hydroxylase